MISRVRGWWRMLTARGKGFLILGVIILSLAIYFKQRDIAWIGLLFITLPIASGVLVDRSRLHLITKRAIAPQRAAVGDELHVEISVEKKGNFPVGLLHFQDTVPRELGRTPRFTVHQPSGGWKRHVGYPMLGMVRGRYKVGPLTVRSIDPFGMAALERPFRAIDEVTITPQIFPLSDLRSATGSGRSGESTPQKIGLVGQDDVLIREYRDGDDMRRVHWKSTARRGELTVRREEQAWDPTMTILIDSRTSRHHGRGRSSSFEWAVSAATSIALHFLPAGFRVRIVDAAGLVHEAPREDPVTGREAITLAMTEIATVDKDSLSAASIAATSARAQELTVAILGSITMDDAAALMPVRSDTSNAIAVVLNTPTFDRQQGAAWEENSEYREAVTQLRGARWKTIEVNHGATVPQAWQEITRVGSVLS